MIPWHLEEWCTHGGHTIYSIKEEERRARGEMVGNKSCFLHWNTCLAEIPQKSNDYLKYFVLSVSDHCQFGFLKAYSSLSKRITLLITTFKEFSSNQNGHTILSKLQPCLHPLFQPVIQWMDFPGYKTIIKCDLAGSSLKQLLIWVKSSKMKKTTTKTKPDDDFVDTFHIKSEHESMFSWIAWTLY